MISIILVAWSLMKARPSRPHGRCSNVNDADGSQDGASHIDQRCPYVGAYPELIDYRVAREPGVGADVAQDHRQLPRYDVRAPGKAFGHLCSPRCDFWLSPHAHNFTSATCLARKNPSPPGLLPGGLKMITAIRHAAGQRQ